MRIVVLGAGIVGVATAWWLHRDGHEVVLVDRREGAALETSWGNGAMLHASSVQPWAAPGMPRAILGYLGKPDAPFLLRPGALPRMWPWGLGFLRNCTAARQRDGALANLALALESRDAMAAMREATGVVYHRVAGAVLKTYATREELEAGAAAHAFLAEAGLAVERLDRDQCVAREPALAAIGGDLAGGLGFPQDELGDCHVFCDGIAGWLRARGVECRFGTAVQGLVVRNFRIAAVQTETGRIAGDAVVVAAGSWCNDVLRAAAVKLPIWPVKGVSLTVPRSAWPAAPRTAILDDRRKVALVPVGEDRLRVVGSAEITGYDTTPDPGRVAAIARGAVEMFPPFAACVSHPHAVPWAGLRPVTPNGLPLTGRTRIEGLWVNGGHGHTGWTLGAGSGKRLAEMMAGRRPVVSVA